MVHPHVAVGIHFPFSLNNKIFRVNCKIGPYGLYIFARSPFSTIVAMGVPILTIFCKIGPFFNGSVKSVVKSGALSSFHTTQGPPLLKHTNHMDQSCNIVFFKSNSYINKIYMCINKKKKK